MRSPESIRDECQRAGYVGPDYYPFYVEAVPGLDCADANVERLGGHLGTAWWELHLVRHLKKKYPSSATATTAMTSREPEPSSICRRRWTTHAQRLSGSGSRRSGGVVVE